MNKLNAEINQKVSDLEKILKYEVHHKMTMCNKMLLNISKHGDYAFSICTLVKYVVSFDNGLDKVDIGHRNACITTCI